MKKHLGILAISLTFFFISGNATAVSPSPSKAPPKVSPTPTPKKNIIEQQINSLTNKIASRVAQLKLVEKRGVIGKVTDVSNTKITIEDTHGNTKFIDVDEFTKFDSSEESSIGISDIKKGNRLGVLGLYNKESRRILARFVNVLELPQIIHGAVSSKDAKNFTISVTTDKEEEYTGDIQSSTRTFSFDKETLKLVKAGFSDIEEGQSIILVGFPDIKDAKLIEATRVILPGLPINPKIKLSVLPGSSNSTP